MITLYPGWREELRAKTRKNTAKVKAMEKLIAKGLAHEQTRTEAPNCRRKPVKT